MKPDISTKSSDLTFVNPADTQADPAPANVTVIDVHLKSNRGEIVPEGTVNAAEPPSIVTVTFVPIAEIHTH